MSTAPLQSSSLDTTCINTLRFLCVDMVQNAASGHPGMPMGAAPMAYVLWTRFLKHNPANPEWFDRDRFILSAGHGSALLYGLLHLTGYDLPLDELKRFRQWGSRTPGHPERQLTAGVETTTGPLGQGFGNGVGMAIAEAHLAARFNGDAFKLIDHYTYGIVSDGDLMEGVASEAASLAGHLHLGKLIYFYDNNAVTLAGDADVTFTEDRAQRFDAYGWHTQTIDDGNDIDAIDRAVRAARAETERPSLILVRTHIGYGAPKKQDTYEAHGSPLGEDEVRGAKEALGWPVEPPFLIPDEAAAHFREAVTRGREAEAEWCSRRDAYADNLPELAADFARRLRSELPPDLEAGLPEFPPDEKGMATRVACGKVMNALAPKLPELIGGSADLDPSTKTALDGQGDFELPEHGRDDWSYAGRNLHFGVREHAMGSICNGLAAHGGVIPFCATFLIFSDYMRPPMRLAAVMKLRVIYVFTHDSLALGQDGPTHQPVEQLANLRAVPNLTLIRPCDANEVAVAWRVALETSDRPVALALSRQNLPTLDRGDLASADNLRRGAYVLADVPDGDADIILIGTGAEVHLALEARQALQERDVNARVVSMPSWHLFDAQPQDYRDAVLPPTVPARLAIEAGVAQGWRRYIGDHGDMVGVDTFGASAPGEEVMRKYGFNVENVCERALGLLKRTH
ncbi:MAG TPA: transketolase [Gammaproteobacteria bacterium]|nr:transketolase [Gammaproteobacteria bacterium]